MDHFAPGQWPFLTFLSYTNNFVKTIWISMSRCDLTEKKTTAHLVGLGATSLSLSNQLLDDDDRTLNLSRSALRIHSLQFKPKNSNLHSCVLSYASLPESQCDKNVDLLKS